MKVFLASDHGGFELKQAIKAFLESRKLERQKIKVIDLGPESNESVDYPDYALKLALEVRKTPEAKGILACGTGIGMSIAANKVKGIRAALAFDEFTARMARNHNDANVLCLGQKTTEKEKALRIVEAFLQEGFDGLKPEGKRHLKRVEKIKETENKNFK